MSPLRRYLAELRPYRARLLFATLLLSVSAALPAGAVLLLEAALNAVLVERDGTRLALLCAGFGALAILGSALRLVRTHVTKSVAWTAASALRQRLFGHLLSLTPRQHESVGQQIAALTDEVDSVQYGVSALVTALRNPLTVIGLGVAATLIAPRLAPWAGLLAVPVGLTAWWSGRRLRRQVSVARHARASLVDEAADQLAAAAAIRDANAQAHQLRRFAVNEAEDQRARIRLEVERTLPSAATQAVVAVAVAALLWRGGQEVLADRLAPGALAAFGVALALLPRPLAGLAEVWSLLQRSLAALDRVYATLDRVPMPAEPEHPVPLPDGPLDLVWRDVVVGWGDGRVLDGANLRVVRGEIVALVGASGAGKSTLLALVRRALAPDAGSVLVGGVDLADLSAADRHRAIAVVLQEQQLLARTVAENVALGRPNAPRSAVEAALRSAGADFVFELPRGIDHPVGERGGQLSGGERQRLCVARALLTRAPILLLDEATNQVDAAAEIALIETLRTTASDRAVLLVCHDAETANRADRIVTLSDGRIAERAGPRVVA